MIKQIPVEKFNFVNDENRIIDQPLKTKQISYYRDAWNRFKKNRASIIALVIISIIMLFTIFGPIMKKVPSMSVNNQNRMAYLTPKIPLIEKLGFFDGSKVLTRDKGFIDSLPEGIVLEVVEESTGSQGLLKKVKVDHYAYVNYIKSYVTEDGQLASRQLTPAQYQLALDRNAVIDVLNIQVIGDDTIYTARVDLFKYSMNQTPEDTYFWFGTNAKGEDLFTVMWNAARISILLALSVTIINLLIGAFIGSAIGYYGGWLDIIFDRVVDVLSSLPFIALLTLVVIAYGSSIPVIILAFIATGWIGSYGRTRMQFYRFKKREYVLAARTLGAKDTRIMYKHIMPNAIGTLITSFSLAIPAFMFGEATYTYLGIISYQGNSSIGELLSNGQATMQNHPHLLLFPAVYISVLMLSFNLMGNGLRDAFNPSLRGVE